MSLKSLRPSCVPNGPVRTVCSPGSPQLLHGSPRSSRWVEEVWRMVVFSACAASRLASSLTTLLQTVHDSRWGLLPGDPQH